MRNEWLHTLLAPTLEAAALQTTQHDSPVEHGKQPAVVWYLPEEDQDEEFPLLNHPKLTVNVPSDRVSTEGSQQINQKVAEIAATVLQEEFGIATPSLLRIGVVRPKHNAAWYHDLVNLNAMGEFAGVYMPEPKESYDAELVAQLESAGLLVWEGEEALVQGLVDLG